MRYCSSSRTRRASWLLACAALLACATPARYVVMSNTPAEWHGTVDASQRPICLGRAEADAVAPMLELRTVADVERYGRLGGAQIMNDHVDFMKDSFAEELKRSAKFAFADRDGDVQVDVKVTKIEMNAPIVETGNFVFLLLAFSRSSAVYVGPVDVTLSGEAVVRRGGKEVLRKPVVGRSRTGVLPLAKRKVDDLMADYTTAMIEGLSLAVKSFNDAVVQEVNGL